MLIPVIYTHTHTNTPVCTYRTHVKVIYDLTFLGLTYVVSIPDGQGGAQLVSQVIWRFSWGGLVVIGSILIIIWGLVVSSTSIFISTVGTLIVIVIRLMKQGEG